MMLGRYVRQRCERYTTESRRWGTCATRKRQIVVSGPGCAKSDEAKIQAIDAVIAKINANAKHLQVDLLGNKTIDNIGVMTFPVIERKIGFHKKKQRRDDIDEHVRLFDNQTFP